MSRLEAIEYAEENSDVTFEDFKKSFSDEVIKQ